MSVPPSDRLGQLSDGQIEFYLAEYQRVLRMFESYTSTEARNLKDRLSRFVKLLTQEVQQRQEGRPKKARALVEDSQQAARTAA